jgi:DNA-binding GntR family transcriptional regulator
LEEQSTETIPAYRSVARAISGRILNGTLPVGSALPSESALAQSLGINRSTVREAIRALEESGMLARRPGGKRLFVTAPRYSKVASRMKAAMVLQEMSFLELWEAMLCKSARCRAAACQLMRLGGLPFQSSHQSSFARYLHGQLLHVFMAEQRLNVMDVSAATSASKPPMQLAHRCWPGTNESRRPARQSSYPLSNRL